MIVLFVAIASSVRAQLAFEFGMNYTNMSVKMNNIPFTTKAHKGICLGMLADMEVSDHVFFEPGLYYETAGAELIKPGGEFRFANVNIPLVIEYKTGERCGPRFFVGGGPVISMNTSGTRGYNSYGPYGIYPSAQGDQLTIGAGRDADLTTKGLDLGLNIGFLFKKHFYVRARTLIGLSNIKSFGGNENSIKTTAMSLNLGWYIHNCKDKISTVFRYKHTRTHWRGLSKGQYSTRSTRSTL